VQSKLVTRKEINDVMYRPRVIGISPVPLNVAALSRSEPVGCSKLGPEAGYDLRWNVAAALYS
jgi:hypothetical protein